MCCARLAENTGRKNDAKTCHLGTISQLCRATSSQRRHVSTIGKISVKQQYLPHMSLQYCELRPTSGWDRFVSLGHPSKFQRLSRLGSVTARYSSSGRQPNCAVEQRAPPIFGRAAITLGIGPHSSWGLVDLQAPDLTWLHGKSFSNYVSNGRSHISSRTSSSTF